MRFNEIFYSIQGEGYFTGTPVIFIRFAGCNLNCSFCDTDFSWKFDLTINELLKRIEKYPAYHIVLTGGEPSLQLKISKRGYSEFVRVLRDKGYYVHIETNGTKKLPNNIDWITVSPKEVEYPNSLIVERGNAIKIIYQGQDIKKYEKMDFDYFYLQPLEKNGKTNVKECVKMVKDNPKWKLSIQTQKILKIK